MERYRFWVWVQTAPKRSGRWEETQARSEAEALKNIWCRLADGKPYLIPRVRQEYFVELDRELEIKKQADAYRKASKGESMSKKNRKFDNLDNWRVTVLTPPRTLPSSRTRKTIRTSPTRANPSSGCSTTTSASAPSGKMTALWPTARSGKRASDRTS